MNLQNAGRLGAVDCSEFMARHADYMDGTLPTLAAARLQAHVEACAACARYDRVVRKGLTLVQELPAIEPSSDFEERLQHRIFHLEDAEALETGRPAAGIATTLAVAAVLALLAWSPVLLPGPDAPLAEAPARSASPASPGTMVDAALVTSPFSGPPSWYGVPAAPASAVLAAFPGPYSPLVVSPPVHRAVRAVSSEYGPVE